MSAVLASLGGQLERIVGLTNALLEVEELRAVGPLHREEVALAELLSDAVRDAMPPDRAVTVDVPDVVVRVNRRWLTIAVSNLLRNAVRHGQGTVTLQAAYDEPWLRVVVRDTGPGFPADFRDVAFDRFSRADASRSTPGSGLGLYLVRAVATAHGGRAGILDEPGAAVEIVVDARGRTTPLRR
jgi:signal transduction histidine kinase